MDQKRPFGIIHELASIEQLIRKKVQHGQSQAYNARRLIEEEGPKPEVIETVLAMLADAENVLGEVIG